MCVFFLRALGGPGFCVYPRVQQDGKTLENEIEVVEGMKFDRGYISPYFVTDNKTQMCEMENPLILIVERKVGRARAVLLCWYCRVCPRDVGVDRVNQLANEKDAALSET